MPNPIWIDLVSTDNQPVTLNATHIVGISTGPRRNIDGEVVHDQVIVNLLAAVEPFGPSIPVRQTIDELWEIIAAATHKAR